MRRGTISARAKEVFHQPTALVTPRSVGVRGGQARLLQTLGEPRTPTPALQPLERGWPWVAQSGCEPRPLCRQRVHGAHGSVWLATALLNCPEDVTKGKLLSAPFAALELGCPLLPGRRELVQARLAPQHPAQRGVTALQGCCGTESKCNCEKEQQTPCCSSGFIHRVSSWFPLGLLGEAGRLSQSGRVGGCRRWQCQAPGRRGRSCDAPAPPRAQPLCQDHGRLHTEFIMAVLSLGSG